jgi:hypothetical protein
MRIGLHDADSTHFPNLAIMKLAAFHKERGDIVERFNALMPYDKIYSSKVFSWTLEDGYLPANVQKGGTGYGMFDDLPDIIEHMCPDYAMYGMDYSIGFLTRGCIRHCPWCIVPKKEGTIHAHADIEEFARHKNVLLMDNNVLAHKHGIEQIEKIARLGLKVDFNQGIDARLIDTSIAKRLAKLKWWKPLRLACDQKSQIQTVDNAVTVLRKAGVKPERYSCYVLVKEIPDALERVAFLRRLKIDPFAQPYREPGSTIEPAKDLKDFARWVNHKAIFSTVAWKNYKGNTKTNRET